MSVCCHNCGTPKGNYSKQPYCCIYKLQEENRKLKNKVSSLELRLEKLELKTMNSNDMLNISREVIKDNKKALELLGDK